jgi:hypothetical protein
MSLYSITSWLYMALSVIFAPITCIIGWRMLIIAKNKRRPEFVSWLLPTMFGATVYAGAVLAMVVGMLLFRRNLTFYSVSYTLSIAGTIFNLVGFIRLWKFVRGLPTGASTEYVKPEYQPGIWPPPPRDS